MPSSSSHTGLAVVHCTAATSIGGDITQRSSLLGCVRSLEPHRVLVLGNEPLEILCALTQLGYDGAAELQPCQTAELGRADVVAAQAPRLSGAVEHLVRQARRALVPGAGWIVLRVKGPASEARSRHTIGVLQDAGFVDVQTVSCPDAIVLMAPLSTSSRAGEASSERNSRLAPVG